MKTLVTRPDAPLLTLSTVKDHLRVDQDDTEFDTILGVYMMAAERAVEQAVGGPVSRQTFSETFAGPNHGGQFLIEGGPECAIGSLEVMASGAYAAIPSSWYLVRPANRFATLVRSAPGFGWPAHDVDEAAFRFTITLGYTKPEPALVAAMLLLVGDLFTNRDAKIPVTLGENPTVGRLLGGFRAPSL